MAKQNLFRTFLDRLFPIQKKSDTFDDIVLTEAYDSNPDSSDLENVESFYKLITKISAIPKSIQEITQVILSQKYIVRDKNKPEKEIKNIPEQLKMLLEKPNELYDFAELVALNITDELISGNIIGYFVEEGKKRYIRRIDPRYFEYFKGSWYENNPYGKIEQLDSRFLIHVKHHPDPYNPRWGKGIIANNITLFTRIIKMLEFTESFYENGCHPTAVISIENGGAMDQKRVDNLLNTRHAGSKNAGKVVTLTGKITYQQIQLDPSALKLSEELTILYKEVMAAFGLPKFLMEVGLKDSGQKYNNHALQMEYFLKSTVIPVAKKIEAYFNNIIQRYNPAWELHFDINSEVYSPEELQMMVETGTINREEHRKLSSLPDSTNENMKVYLIPSGLQTIDNAVEGVGEEVTPANDFAPVPDKNPQIPPKEPINAPVPPKNKIDNGHIRKKSWRDEHYLSEPQDGVWTVDEIKSSANQKRMRQDFINLNTKTRNKKSKEATIKYSLHLIDVYGEILANVAKNAEAIEALSNPEKGEKTDLPKIIEKIYDDGEGLIKMEKISLPIWHSVGEATYSNTGNILTSVVAFNISDPGVAKKINLLRKDGPLVTQKTKGKLTETIQAGISVGKTHTEIAKDIWLHFVDENNDLADEFSKIYRPGVKPKDFDAVMARGGKLQSRASLIARTEVARANRLFASASMSKSNVVKTVTIINCEPGCPICGPHQNVEVSFSESDEISNLHPNCSGTVVPGTISTD